MNAERAQLIDLLNTRVERTQRLGRRLVGSFVLLNLVGFVAMAIILSSISYQDVDEVAPALVLSLVVANLLNVAWTRKRSAAARALADIDAQLERFEGGGAPAATEKPGSTSESWGLEVGIRVSEPTGETRERGFTAEGRRRPRTASPKEAPEGTSNAGTIAEGAPPWILRAFYFLLVGSWLGIVWGYISLLLCLLILPLPAGQWMFQQMPRIMTLSARPTALPDASHRSWSCPILLRSLYFLLVGCWLGVLMYHIGLVLCLLLLPISLGLKIFRAMPTFLTLQAPRTV